MLVAPSSLASLLDFSLDTVSDMAVLRRRRGAFGARRKRNCMFRPRLQLLQRREMLAADVWISEFLAANTATLRDDNGEFSDWIEIHNSGDEAADLSGWHLTDDPGDLTRWTFPGDAASMIGPDEYLVLFASGDGVAEPSGNLHTNFGLAASGEYLALVRPDLSIASQFGPDRTDYPTQRSDISYGIDPNVTEGDPSRYFSTPTPAGPNADSISGFVADTTFSVDRGYFEDAFSVEIASPTVGATLVYTLDGSQPTLANGTQVYAGTAAAPRVAVSVSTTTTLRAAAFKQGFQSTNVDTQTYLFIDDVIHQPADPSGFPSTWGSAPGADYAMDPEVTADPHYTQDLLTGLRDLPAISLVSEVDSLFGAGGIYTNPLDGSLEVPVSAEYILADGSSGFQIDAGLKVAGGASRNPNNSPKHSMSLRFRSTYGASKLEYDLFDGSPVNVFNSLQLRAVYNNSWIHWDQGQRSRGTLIRDQFIRDSLIAAGQDDAGRGHYSHVYLNGLYWGVYNLHERADSSHFAAHNGGDADDFDALNGGTPVDGTITSWNNVKAIAASRDWNAIRQVLDVDNFIDWTLVQAYGGNADLKTNGNWRAAGGGSADAKWRMYAWDSERVLEGVTAKPPATITDATGLFDDLIEVPEFRVRFGDRIQEHFSGDGAFTPAASSGRWNARAEQLRNAIVAESARWGDYRRDVHPRGVAPLLYRRDQAWIPEVDRVSNEFLPGRTDFVFDQYVALGWIPSIKAPEFRVNGAVADGGVFPAGSSLRLTADEGRIYYTIDGTDPRREGGAIAPAARVYDPMDVTSEILASGARWKFEDSGTDLGTGWREHTFDDSSWSSGLAQLGFGDGDEATVVSFGGDENDKHRTTYFRKSFDVASSNLVQLTLRLRRDDGAVVYLNGTEIARDNLPAGTIDYSTRASMAAPDDGTTWIEFDVPVASLTIGTNTLAVEVHQNSPRSSDLSFDAQLIGVTHVSPPIPLNESIEVGARTRLLNGEWSALQAGQFRVPNEPASWANLRITEINYNPALDGDAEYLEIRNVTSGENAVTVDLGGVTLTDGPSTPFVFPVNSKLAPGEFALLVHDLASFQAAYPGIDPALVIGQYSGKLSNGGERIRMVDAGGAEIVDLTYATGDPWTKWADGLGGSLVLIDPVFSAEGVPAHDVDRLGKSYQYFGSVEPGGNPGTTGAIPSGVVINEILAHTDAPLSDSIELYNSTSSEVDLSGWFLSDEGEVPNKYRFPDATVIEAGGYLVIDESDFNPALPNATSLQPFALSASRGDSVWLFIGDGSDATGFADHASFDATYNGVSLGRLDGSQGRLVPLANRSLGMINGMFQSSVLSISEINYHPSDPTAAALAIDPSMVARDLEFVEIENVTARTVSLRDWRLRGEGDYDFAPADQLAAGEVIVVVSFDPQDPSSGNRENAFRAHYAIGPGVRLVGPFAGTLNNSQGIVKLQAPDEPPVDDPAWIPHVTVDEVFYDDLPPWPVAADAGGASLQRVAASTLGVYADSWRGETPTPGDVPVRPIVESIWINDDTASRSAVTSVSVQFDREVDVSPAAFVLMHRESGQSVQELRVDVQPSNGKSIARMTFGVDPLVVTRSTDGHSLVDGNYELRIVAAEVRTLGTDVAMESDHRFGSEASDAFFRYFGDSDGDRDVDGHDYGHFGLTFERSRQDQGYDPNLDFEGDGDVDGIDHAQIARRLLGRLAY
jgi:hypothetical protein